MQIGVIGVADQGGSPIGEGFIPLLLGGEIAGENFVADGALRVELKRLGGERGCVAPGRKALGGLPGEQGEDDDREDGAGEPVYMRPLAC